MVDKKKIVEALEKAVTPLDKVASRVLLDKITARVIDMYPNFAEIVLWVPLVIKDASGFLAYTDGKVIVFGKDAFNLTPAELAGLLIHETLHVAFNHMSRGRGGLINQKVWNICCDALINEGMNHLDRIKLPPGGVYLNTVMDLIDRERKLSRNLCDWSEEALYHAYMKSAMYEKSNKNGSEGGVPEEYNGDLKDNPGGDEGYNEGDIPEHLKEGVRLGDSQREQDWQARLESARQKGNSSNDLFRSFNNLDVISKTPWQNVLRFLLMRELSNEVEENYARPSRTTYITDIFHPKIKDKEKVGTIGIVVDTSGSIGDDLLNQFAKEIDIVQRLTRADIKLIYADCIIQAEYDVTYDSVPFVDKIKQGKYQAKGGGGTSFVDPIEKLDGKVNVIIYLTDLYGDFPDKPQTKVIWAVTGGAKHIPYGALVSLA